MTPESAQALRQIILTQPIVSLGTLHDGQPYVSMVPFALQPDGAAFLIHVSTLAAHTKDMLANPAVSVLIIAPPSPEVPPQALARVTIQGQAAPYGKAESGYAEARAAYLARFPHSAEMFGFGDFSLFRIVPTGVRFVGGFAQARSLQPEALIEILRAQ